MPTIGAILGASDLKMRAPADGIDLQPLFDGKMSERPRPLPFSWTRSVGLVDNRYKICHGDPNNKRNVDEWHLYDLIEDPIEANNLAEKKPDLLATTQKQLADWVKSTGAGARARWKKRR